MHKWSMAEIKMNEVFMDKIKMVKTFMAKINQG
jgi:hypothetical protein